jgi:hypothetical protein
LGENEMGVISDPREITKGKIKAGADQDTLSALTYDFHRLRTKMMNKPKLIKPAERAYMGDNLSKHLVSDDDIHVFHLLKQEFNKAPKKATIPVSEKIDFVDGRDVVRFKVMLKDLMTAKLPMTEDILKAILDMKLQLYMTEEDLKQCLAILKRGIRNMYYA